MLNEILLYPNNELLINGLYRSKITYFKHTEQGIILNVTPISQEDYIQDDLDVMYDVSNYLFDLYLKDSRLAHKLIRPKYWYSDVYKRWVFEFPFK